MLVVVSFFDTLWINKKEKQNNLVLQTRASEFPSRTAANGMGNSRLEPWPRLMGGLYFGTDEAPSRSSPKVETKSALGWFVIQGTEGDKTQLVTVQNGPSVKDGEEDPSRRRPEAKPASVSDERDNSLPYRRGGGLVIGDRDRQILPFSWVLPARNLQEWQQGHPLSECPIPPGTGDPQGFMGAGEFLAGPCCGFLAGRALSATAIFPDPVCTWRFFVCTDPHQGFTWRTCGTGYPGRT